MTNINNSTAVENVTNNRKSTVTNVEFYDSVLQLANEGFRPVYWNNDGELFGVVYHDEDHIMCSLDGTLNRTHPILTAVGPDLENVIIGNDAESLLADIRDNTATSSDNFDIEQLPLVSYKEKMDIIASWYDEKKIASMYMQDIDAYQGKEAEIKHTRFEQLPEKVQEVFANSSSKTFIK